MKAIILLILTVSLLSLGQLPKEQVQTTKTETKIEQPEILGATETYLANVLARINNSRSSRGIHRLGRRAVLDRTAQAKCRHMVKYGYWAHNPPGTTFDAHMRANGFIGTWYGEILARGYYGNVTKQHYAWLNSPDHRSTMLHRKPTIFGAAVCYYPSGKDLTVVHFGRP